MPLDPLQERIARTALGLPEARTLALAGGGAMIVHGFVTRETKDVDLFTEVDEQEAVQVTAALRRALEQQGLDTCDAEGPPFDHRFVTFDQTTGAECTVEVLTDGGRLQPSSSSPSQLNSTRMRSSRSTVRQSIQPRTAMKPGSTRSMASRSHRSIATIRHRPVGGGTDRLLGAMWRVSP